MRSFLSSCKSQAVSSAHDRLLSEIPQALSAEESQDILHAVHDSEFERDNAQQDQCRSDGDPKRHSQPCDDWPKCHLPECSPLDINETGNKVLVGNDSALEIVQIPSEWAFAHVSDPIVALETTQQSEMDWWNLDLPLNIQDLLSGLSTY